MGTVSTVLLKIEMIKLIFGMNKFMLTILRIFRKAKLLLKLKLY